MDERAEQVMEALEAGEKLFYQALRDPDFSENKRREIAMRQRKEARERATDMAQRALERADGEILGSTNQVANFEREFRAGLDPTRQLLSNQQVQARLQAVQSADEVAAMLEAAQRRGDVYELQALRDFAPAHLQERISANPGSTYRPGQVAGLRKRLTEAVGAAEPEKLRQARQALTQAEIDRSRLESSLKSVHWQMSTKGSGLLQRQETQKEVTTDENTGLVTKITFRGQFF